MSWKKKVRQAIMGAALIVMGAAMVGCGSEAPKEAAKLPVVTTIFPVYDVAKQVGGDKVNVSLLIPPGAEPHDWEPSAGDLKAIGTAKVFLYSGAGLEPTEKLLTKDVLKDAKAYELSKGLELLALEEDHDGVDPHVWLDPMNMMKEVDMVVSAFSEVDPANKDYYHKNGEAYKEKLKQLDASYSAFFQKLEHKELVVSHEAFGYLAHRYGLEQVGIMGVAPDAEPTPERMAEIVEFIREHDVKAIFSEVLVSPKLAEAISKETGVKVFVLNPSEGLTKEQEKQGLTYLDIMEENLKTLKEALH